MALIVQVDPGPAWVVADRVFVVPEVSRPSLADVIESYGVGKGDRLDEGALDEADEGLEDVLRGRRYPLARVRQKVLVEGGIGFVYVYVDPGPHLRFRFEGNERFDGDHLTDVIDYDKEPDRTPAALGDKVQTFYRRVGMLVSIRRIVRRSRLKSARIGEGEVATSARRATASPRIPRNSLPFACGPRQTAGGPRVGIPKPYRVPLGPGLNPTRSHARQSRSHARPSMRRAASPGTRLQ